MNYEAQLREIKKTKIPPRTHRQNRQNPKKGGFVSFVGASPGEKEKNVNRFDAMAEADLISWQNRTN